jgi:HK97 family phage major capsid protein
MSQELLTALREWQSANDAKLADVNKSIGNLVEDIKNLQNRIAPGFLPSGSPAGDPVDFAVKSLRENLGDFNRTGRLRLETPSFLGTAKAFTSSGLTAALPAPTIGASEAFAYGAVRRALPAEAIEAGSIFQIRETAHLWEASPQAESSAKNESSATLTGETIPVRTLATWVSATRQALDDVVGLAAFIRARLVWALEREIEEQILSGDGTGNNLAGLATQAAAFDTGFLTPGDGYEYADVLLAALTQVTEAGFNPNLIVLSPRDWYTIARSKASDGQYILGSPAEARNLTLWSRSVIVTPAMTAGTFIVGDAAQAIVRVRQQATLDVSESHSDYFVKNMIALRIEERLALQVVSPSAFVTGSLVQSPA